jgi:beta-lactamase regulating signal transducer with metallopeptidase domain
MNLTQALGWTLIHFLWQGAIVAAVLECVLVLLRQSGPRTRYAASCAAMILMLVSATATFLDFQFGSRSSSAAAVPFEQVFLKSGFWTASTGIMQPQTVITDYLPLFVWTWFGGVMALSLRSLGGWAVATRFARRHTSPAEAFWEERFAALLKRLRISRPVTLAISSVARVPAVVGWAKPIVLLPATVFTGLTAEQIEGLLAHELAHVRRHDYAINLLQTVAETLLFYHPAVWWVSRCIRNERENCCDDVAVEICGNPATYVRALADLEQLRGDTPGFAIAANGGLLLGRVERLLRLSPDDNSARSGLFAMFGVAVVCLSVIGIEASGFIKRQQPTSSRLHQAARAEVEAPIEALLQRPAPQSAKASVTTSQAQPETQRDGPQQSSGDWLAEIDAAGFHELGVEKLIELKIHGIDGNYIREIRAAGFDPPVDKLLELKIHGIDGEYVRQIRATGLQLTLDILLEFRIHGITADFINQQNQTGLGTLGPDKLLELKIHGVTPDFIQEVRSLGYSDITADKILEMKIHGLTPEFMRDAKSRFKDLSLDQMIQLKIYNILK